MCNTHFISIFIINHVFTLIPQFQSNHLGFTQLFLLFLNSSLCHICLLCLSALLGPHILYLGPENVLKLIRMKMNLFHVSLFLEITILCFLCGVSERVASCQFFFFLFTVGGQVCCQILPPCWIEKHITLRLHLIHVYISDTTHRL